VIDAGFKMLVEIVYVVVAFVPIAAFAATAFTVCRFGLRSLTSLGLLVGCVYLTMGLFIILILGPILRTTGIGLTSFLRYLREELVLVLGTSSSETALPGLMSKLEQLGCSKSVVGLVVPTGYSFNLDGTSIYLTIAVVFVAQAADVSLSLAQQLGILAVLLLTSKGAAAVTGGGFVTLSATLTAMQTIPVAGLSLLLGVDRFMSQARAVTNLVGNGVATIVVASVTRNFDRRRAQQVLAGKPLADDLAVVATEPEVDRLS